MSEPKTRFILASASPRRTEILTTLGLDFDVRVPDVDERQLPGESPQQYVMRAAVAKVRAVVNGYRAGVVIGADTVVVIDGQPLGKPGDAADAKRMLRALGGRWHAVMTGVAVQRIETGDEAVDFEKTLVRFRDLADEEIEAYIATGEPVDKAGAYAIQGRGMLFVTEIAGNYQNVVGLPVPLLDRLVRQIGANLRSGEE
ncbi:MAG: septum formation inhibitor Maf [Blastocatellia bacterium]|nr:septum formation inhibitor Maf [Blastocatellia bacterium]